MEKATISLCRCSRGYINETAALETWYLEWCIWNSKKNYVAYFSKIICNFLLICFRVDMSKIVRKNDKSLLNYSNLGVGGQFLFRRSVCIQVAQLSQRDRATHELLRFAKLRSGIFEPPFWGLRRNVDASYLRRWKKRGRLPIGHKLNTLASTHSWGIAKVAFLSHPLGT